MALAQLTAAVVAVTEVRVLETLVVWRAACRRRGPQRLQRQAWRPAGWRRAAASGTGLRRTVVALLDGDDLVQPGAGLCEDGVGQPALRMRFGITRAPVERLSPWRRVWRGLACKHRAMPDQLADAPTRGYKTRFAMLTSGFGPQCVPR